MFQSTHPRGVRPSEPYRQTFLKGFNPRTREGCDNRFSSRYAISTCFNPRTREGCDDVLKDFAELLVEFQSTHPRGVRHNAPTLTQTNFSFNPRTREGCDFNGNYYLCGMKVSIHAPARGATTSNLFHRRNINGFNPRTREGCDFRR